MSSSTQPGLHNIEDLIPHRDRMKCIEEILEVDDDHCVTKAVASPNWPLCREGRIDSIITIELVAQTAAAYVGWGERSKGTPAGKGFIVGIKKAALETPDIAAGSQLIISCKKTVTLENYAEFEGDVWDEERVYGRVQIQVFRP